MTEEEKRLWEEYFRQPTAESRRRLCEYYLPLARLLAHKVRRSRKRMDCELEDLVHVAVLGILDGIPRYNPARSQPKTYLGLRAQGAIFDWIRQHSGLIRCSRTSYREASSRVSWEKLNNELEQPEDPFKVYQVKEEIATLLEQLPDQETAWLLYEHWIRGRRCRDIAQELGCKEQRIWNKMWKGLRKLRALKDKDSHGR